MTFASHLKRCLAVVGASLATVASAQSVTVVEYYNSAVDAYFITGRTAEQNVLDGVADFKRTLGLDTVLIGFGLSGSSFNLVLSAFSKLLPPERRGIALGAGTAAGSFGQFLFAPFGVAMTRM